jgi:hypothetical protein
MMSPTRTCQFTDRGQSSHERSPGTRYHISFACVLALLGAGLPGCHDGDPGVANEQSQEVAAQSDAGCVDFEGLTHCPLGSATVSLGKDGRQLEVTRMADPRRDGVSILLPDVSSFHPDGRVEGSGPGVSLTASAFQAGTIVGRMTLQKTDDSYVVSAAFTGTGGSSPYQVNLYRQDELVGSIAGLQSGQRLALRRVRPVPWCCWPPPPPFRNMQRGPNVGACVWDQSFAGDEVVAALSDGTTVVADRIELEEVIPRAGSYPYMSFNRIDYTTDGAALVLTGERIE